MSLIVPSELRRLVPRSTHDSPVWRRSRRDFSIVLFPLLAFVLGMALSVLRAPAQRPSLAAIVLYAVAPAGALAVWRLVRAFQRGAIVRRLFHEGEVVVGHVALRPDARRVVLSFTTHSEPDVVYEAPLEPASRFSACAGTQYVALYLSDTHVTGLVINDKIVVGHRGNKAMRAYRVAPSVAA